MDCHKKWRMYHQWLEFVSEICRQIGNKFWKKIKKKWACRLARTLACSVHVACGDRGGSEVGGGGHAGGGGGGRGGAAAAVATWVRVALTAQVGLADWGRHWQGDWVRAVAARGGSGRPRDGADGLARWSGSRGGRGDSGRRRSATVAPTMEGGHGPVSETHGQATCPRVIMPGYHTC